LLALLGAHHILHVSRIRVNIVVVAAAVVVVIVLIIVVVILTIAVV
jgi:hypothetical protein